MENYLSIIGTFGMDKNIDKFYNNLCNKINIKNLFFVLFPYKNIYCNPNFIKLLTNFEDNNLIVKEVKDYCDGFLAGYKNFKKAKLNDNDIIKFVVNFDYTYLPYFDENGKIELYGIFDYGTKAGKCYFSWCYILNHQSDFELLFDVWLKSGTKSEKRNKTKLSKECLEEIFTWLSETNYIIGIKDDWLSLFFEEYTSTNSLTWNEKPQKLADLMSVICETNNGYVKIYSSAFNLKNVPNPQAKVFKKSTLGTAIYSIIEKHSLIQ